MSFDMEPDHDEHTECRREIERLRAGNTELREVLRQVLRNWRVGHQADEYPALLIAAAEAEGAGE